MSLKSLWKITFQHPWFQDILAFLVYGYLRLVGLGIRWTLRDVAARDAVMDQHGACIVCFWHNRLAMMPWGWRGRKESFHMLISSHNDGQFIADVIGFFGLKTIYGSMRNQTKTKNKGGARAYRDLLGALKKGGAVGITPDGPRGPRHQVHLGILKLAQRAGIPIVPASVATRRRWVLRRTWDRFIIPSPLGKAALMFGSPLSVPPEATAEELQALAAELTMRLNAVDRFVDESVAETIKAKPHA
jgi:lysophospholipid acyltransferase (LPLAT)-like uncharacterized protein